MQSVLIDGLHARSWYNRRWIGQIVLTNGTAAGCGVVRWFEVTNQSLVGIEKYIYLLCKSRVGKYT